MSSLLESSITLQIVHHGRFPPTRRILNYAILNVFEISLLFPGFKNPVNTKMLTIITIVATLWSNHGAVR